MMLDQVRLLAVRMAWEVTSNFEAIFAMVSPLAIV